MEKEKNLAKERKEVLPILAALVAAIAPHVPGLPLWINIWCFTMWGYMLTRLKTGWPLPRASVRYILTFAGIAGLLGTYRMSIGADAFVGLMALMAAIKIFEMPTHRHQMITILLTYFMIITSLFRSDALFTVVYMLFSVFITTAAMVNINSPAAPFRQNRKLAATILAQALPLVVILFMVFPRLPAALVGFQDPGQGKTGFTETMEPGRISTMARDQTPAFRVSFDTGLPPADQLYWRGIVFQSFDGKAWRPGKHQDVFPLSDPKEDRHPREKDIHQTILLAPHNSHWLMALDRPVQGPSWAALGKDQTLKSRKKIGKKTQYKVISRLPDDQAAPLDHDTPRALKNRVLADNDNQNPKSLQLAREVAESAHTPREKANRLLAYFKNNGFIYTLKAPLSGPHPLDTFMFKTKKGYCEHYAAAFAFMLNGAGVPARVVGGYLGGELNPFGDYLIVRQSYAHAWVEFFDPETGWTRLDPTSVVSPERMFTNPDGSSSRTTPGNATLSMITRLKFALDAVNLKWESWFTGYSLLEQKAWLAALGLIRENRSPAPVLIFLTLLGAAVFSALLIRRFKRTKGLDPVAMAMKGFYKRMENLGFTPAPGQGPKAFMEFCIEKRPDLSKEIQSILDLYLGLRYKRGGSETAPAELKARVKKFNPS